MASCSDESTLDRYMHAAAAISEGQPVLIDRFLEDAFEVDLDLLCDGRQAVVAGILQHIEEAGIHSRDSVAVLPPYKGSHDDPKPKGVIAPRLAPPPGAGGLVEVPVA